MWVRLPLSAFIQVFIDLGLFNYMRHIRLFKKLNKV
ncbi:protein of unknown function [Petrocella atlantisensis]|uniref:Uncharacterized protein n=1 Tax=Petrocella atlantisensis TaxID=2173034 RepID=A0A3P7RSQ0_9FIRM|nr:protein of unknown function [Petrocella atlantisensis]